MTVDSNFKECIFCHQSAQSVPLVILQDFMDIYFCHSCQAEYCTKKNSKENISHHLYTMINNEMFRISFYGSSFVQIWHIKYPGTPGKIENRGLTSIISFNENILPNITPANVNEKLRTYILFS